MEFGGLVGPGSVDSKEAKWAKGYAIGGGMEHAVSDTVSVGMDYMYMKFGNTSHFLTDGALNSGTVDMKYNAVHTIRASVNYRFSL